MIYIQFDIYFYILYNTIIFYLIYNKLKYIIQKNIINRKNEV